MSHENILNLKKFRKKLARELKINANNQSFYCCYSRCAHKQFILDLYLSHNNEIIFGRRGTGKTTILKGLSYYVNQLPHDDEYFNYAIYIDMEDIVPNKIELKDSSDDSSREIYRLILLKILELFYSFFDRIIVGNSYFNLVRFSDEDINKIAELIVELEDTVKEGSRTVDNTTETSKTSEETLKSRTKDLQLMGTAENRSWLASLKASIAKSFSKTNSSSITTETQLEYRININEIRILLEQLL